MKEPFLEKIKRLLHGTIFFPHKKRLFQETDGTNGLFCTCGWIKYF